MSGSTYMRYLEQLNSQRWKVEWWFPGAGESRKGGFVEDPKNEVEAMEVFHLIRQRKCGKDSLTFSTYL